MIGTDDSASMIRRMVAGKGYAATAVAMALLLGAVGCGGNNGHSGARDAGRDSGTS